MSNAAKFPSNTIIRNASVSLLIQRLRQEQLTDYYAALFGYRSNIYRLPCQQQQNRKEKQEYNNFVSNNKYVGKVFNGTSFGTIWD